MEVVNQLKGDKIRFPGNNWFPSRPGVLTLRVTNFDPELVLIFLLSLTCRKRFTQPLAKKQMFPAV